MTNRKRIMACLLAIVMVVSTLPMLASAATSTDGFEYKLKNETVEIVGYTGSDTNVAIPDMIEGLPVTAIGNGAFRNRVEMTDVTLPSQLTTIGSSAFSGCTGLTEITIPASVTTVGLHAFYDCKQITAVHTTDLAAWCQIDFDYKDNAGNWGSSPLYYAKKLYVNGELVTDLVVPEGVTRIGDGVFCNVKQLTSITIPNSVTEIGDYAFFSCAGLTEIVIPEGVTVIGDNAFGVCLNVTDITLPNTLQQIDAYAFQHLAVEQLTIPDSVSVIGDYAFRECVALTNLQMSDTVTYIGEYAFGDCETLTTVSLPDSLIFIGEYAFGNTGLTSITIPANVVTLELDAFSYCDNLTDVTILSDTITEFSAYAFDDTPFRENAVRVNGGWYYEEYLIDVSTDVSGNFTVQEGTTIIAGCAFADCANLTGVTFPDTVVEIGAKAFWGCENLSSISLPKHITCIRESTFKGCLSLTGIVVPEGVRRIETRAFEDCEALQSITLPDSVERIGYRAFSSTAYLADENNQKEGAAYIGHHLIQAYSSYIVDYQYTVKDGTITIADNAFSGVTALREVSIPDSVIYIGANAFSGTNLNHVTLPDTPRFIGKDAFLESAYYYEEDNWTGDLLYIGSYLVNVAETISDEITVRDGTVMITDGVFADRANLTAITLPETLGSIGESTFTGCGALATVTYLDTIEQWERVTVAADNAPLLAAELISKPSVNLECNGVKLNATTDEVAEDVTLLVEETTAENAGLGYMALLSQNASVLYDVSLRKEEVAVQPNGWVMVSIPIPADMTNEECRIFYIDEAGTATDMQAVLENGYMVFFTDHFSYYALVQVPDVALGDVDGTDGVTASDALLALQGATNKVVLTGTQKQAADVDGKEGVSANDALMILQYATKKITTF